MARIRTIKPEMAKHELLFELEQSLQCNVRFAWAMLPTQCDREGRFPWRPRVLKVEILPFDSMDFERVLDAWLKRGMIVKYRVGDDWYGWMPTFRKHQQVNNKERESEIPSTDQANELIDYRFQPLPNATTTREQRDDNANATPLQGKGKERKGKEENTSAELNLDAGKPEEKPTITLPTNTGDEYPVLQDQITEWQSLYPAVDVLQELRNMRGWLLANHTKRKTAKGMTRFVNSWLSRQQDKGGSRFQPQQQPAQGEWFQTAKGVEDKGRELGLSPEDFPVWSLFKTAVIEKAREAEAA